MKFSSTLASPTKIASLSAGILLFLNGCATPSEHSFNHDFGENLTTQPKYYIKDESEEHFKIVVHQGSPSNGAERVIDQKRAATAVARAEAERLGWKKWHLDYIQEREQGWMHVVIGRVTREPYSEPTFPN